MSDACQDSIPTEFPKVMKDFVGDILLSFPEYRKQLAPCMLVFLEEDPDMELVKLAFEYCRSVYPERFFDLLYQNGDVFSDVSKGTCFLKGVDFSDIWSEEVSEKTRQIIWKYLQLVLFSVVNTQNDSNSFGDAAKLFEAINEKELKSKLEEAMGEMAKVFDVSGMESMFEGDVSGVGLSDLPDVDELHGHISGLLKGGLGRLATEITEETLKDLDADLSDVNSVGDVFQKLFKNPGKLMNMIKKVGTTLDEKLKSGELKESELMEEAADLMEKMKSMPGMKNMQNMLGQMGMGGGRNARMNVGAMRGHMQQNLRQAKMRERMRSKLAARQGTDEQIKVLREQLEEARAANAQQGAAVDENKKKKKRRKKRKSKNKK